MLLESLPQGFSIEKVHTAIFERPDSQEFGQESTVVVLWAPQTTEKKAHLFQ